jgi:SAM-dependent methyltransferase
VPDDPETWLTRRSDRLERKVLAHLLARASAGRVLEIGVGKGRLVGLITALGSAVAIDDSFPRVRELRRATSDGGALALATADGHNLPFRDGSFRSVLLVRVLHLSPTPDQLLREIRRVLVPGGALVLSYYPTPSAKTWHHRFWTAVHPPGGSRGPAGGGRPPREDLLPRRAVPLTVSTVAIERMVVESGFKLEERWGVGWEELSLVGRLPESFFLGFARALPNAPGYPGRIARFRAI